MSHIKTKNKHAKISPVLQETAQQEQDAKNHFFFMLLPWLLDQFTQNVTSRNDRI